MHTTLRGAVAGLGLALAAAFTAHAQSGSVLFDQTVETAHVSWDPLYSVYLPHGYESGERSYPIVYLLPGGAGMTHRDWFLAGGAAETLDRMIAEGEIPPVVVVSPDPRRLNRPEFNTYYLDDADGSERWETMFFEDFLPQVEQRYRVLAERQFRAIVGVSMGGYGGLIYAFRQPDVFAAVGALAPAIRTDAQIVEMNQAGWDRRYGQTWGVGLEGEARLSQRYYSDSVFWQIEQALAAGSLPRTQIMIDTGSNDIFFDGSVLLHQMLRSEGTSERTLSSAHRFRIGEGGHDWPYFRSAFPEAMRFVTNVMMN